MNLTADYRRLSQIGIWTHSTRYDSMTHVTDPTLRFSSRAENYYRYRPRYPQAVVITLQQECQLTPASLIADIGSGTGFLTELFLKNGNQVLAVEPNHEMREASVRLLEKYSGFHDVDGRAEATTLSDSSIDFVVAGQSFHWFDRPKAQNEFLRVLKPAGWMMIVWNERDIQASPFMAAYDRILQDYVTDSTRLAHKKVYDTALDDFFGAQGFTTRVFHYHQHLDYEGVKGRLLSSSYTPESGHPNHAPMLHELAKIFHAHETGERVTLEYVTRMYYGRLS
jgi:SAM-dependent methyltransferase